MASFLWWIVGFYWEVASEADLSSLPKYRFHLCKDEEKPNAGAGKMVPIETSSRYLANDRILLPEDTMNPLCKYNIIKGNEQV
ncbi:hypothetical protein RND71_023328 [Anisodus tanguticus]|uniref:Uncharacterized protein n=1 Tax=Anisodus tanguticus TaxID=243964 RepID=A0AAE1RTQ2_9SOLA|nr:hypothetical protein RND71_023328 [Anisodus tanguticus]